MTANCIHLFRWPWRVARWSADARIRDTDTRRPTFPSFTLQASPLHPLSNGREGAAATDHHHHDQRWLPPLLLLRRLPTPPALFHSASPPPFAASPPEASFAFIEGAMSPFSPFLGEGSLNGREKRTNRAALLFSDSSGTVQSLASRDSMRRARPILTGFNSVFEGEKSLGPEQRQREREGRGIDERAARF